MVDITWKVKKGDLVRISSSNGPSLYSYGVVTSPAPYIQQQSLFPVVKVFSFAEGVERAYYPYNLEIVSQGS
jgi:hypothetical protein